MMNVRSKYSVEKHHISNKINRSRRKLHALRFGVAHETGNNTADAMAHVNYFENHNIKASYHIIIDSNRIVELIPKDEIALHVRRNLDRKTLGLGTANDNAIAISMCRTGIFTEAYDRFVWTWAMVCVQNQWHPKVQITAHRFEDPSRRSDPHSWLEPNGVSWETFLDDVEKYISAWESEISLASFNELASVPKTKEVSEKKSSSNFNLPNAIYRAIRPYPAGTDIKKVQTALASINFFPDRFAENQGIDGIYGPKTANAVRRFQQMHLAHEVDGIYGPNTRKKLIQISRTCGDGSRKS